MPQDNKTQPGDGLAAYLNGLEAPRRAEADRLIAIFRQETGFEPVLWGPSIVGFGRYDYVYKSGRKGSHLATGFSARKAELVVYILPGYTDFSPILADLGKHKIGKSCLYLKRLDGVNEDALRRLIRAGLADLAKHWPVFPA